MNAAIKKIPVFLILTCLTAFAYGQSLSMDVLATSGSEFISEEISLSWTIGESFVETFKVEQGIQTLGFHQTLIISEPLKAESQNNPVWIYPNPVATALTLRSKEDVGNALLKVIAMTGETVFEQKIEMKTSFTLNLSFLNKGTYHLRLINDNSQGITFIKL